MITNVFRDDEVPSDAWLLAQIKILTTKLDELELRLRDEQGDAGFADYERTVARKIGHDGDDDNVIGLRGRRKP